MGSNNTHSGYYARAKRFKEYFGNIKMRKISTSQLEDFLDDLFY
ncbi:MAG: hypothetical protein IKS09_08320 [Lachnospiraceae bacterium]|nr:hypothetical protein [Lachnospiraceae bacterium]